MLLLIDKPSGFTSFDIVRKVKRLYPKEKVGHAGTLDPLATGLLILGIGKDTKKLGNIVGEDKDYITTIDFSKSTDTRDADYRDKYEEYDCLENGIKRGGNFIESPTKEEIRNFLDKKIKKGIFLVPPFSAKKKKGKKFYELARNGKNLKMTAEMEIFEYKILSYKFPFLKLFLRVGKGTYIRSIAYELGEKFGLGGIVADLRRERIGEFSL